MVAAERTTASAPRTPAESLVHRRRGEERMPKAACKPHAVRKATKLIGALPWISKANMAPKNPQNIGDKGEGARQIRVGKNGSDTGPAGIRPASGPTKLSSKTGGGSGKDDKDGKDIIRGAPLNPRGKGKSQPAITNVLTSGVQDSGIESFSSPPKDTPHCLQENSKTMTHREEPLQAKEGPYGSNSPPVRPQDGEGWLLDDPSSFKEQTALNDACARAPISNNMQLQAEEHKQLLKLLLVPMA
ncbi:hypothetical protein NDU88_002580 [Pleurodeles waltl]|uniref:Uncharacterized protein n=1 Tax=Pleurodeles waltl TaxID=8319 RepID=A0AAV7W3N3_PLEWA|nr:hypothetical protein NDU88_002580 [Pleurodeles waltl]